MVELGALAHDMRYTLASLLRHLGTPNLWIQKANQGTKKKVSVHRTSRKLLDKKGINITSERHATALVAKLLFILRRIVFLAVYLYIVTHGADASMPG